MKSFAFVPKNLRCSDEIPVPVHVTLSERMSGWKSDRASELVCDWLDFWDCEQVT